MTTQRQSPSTSAISTLYTFQPAYRNDFELRFIEGLTTDTLVKMAPFHAMNVVVNGAQLILNRHNITKLFAVSTGEGGPYRRTDSVTIVWRESKDRAVTRYHKSWLGQFYDEGTDRYQSVSDPSVLTKTAVIDLPDGTVTLYNLIPAGVPPLDLSWANKSLTTFSIKYYVSHITWTDHNG